MEQDRLGSYSYEGESLAALSLFYQMFYVPLSTYLQQLVFTFA